MQPIAIFSTCPIEILYAAGLVPRDINNLFVTHERPESLLAEAEAAGIPPTVCTWTRALLGTTVAHRFPKALVVVRGDCANNAIVGRLLLPPSVEVIEFSYPQSNSDRPGLRKALRSLMRRLNVAPTQVDAVFERFRPIRQMLLQIDQLAAQGRIPAPVARFCLLDSTDMGGDPDKYQARLAGLIAECLRDPQPALAALGPPPPRGAAGQCLSGMAVPARPPTGPRDARATAPAGGGGTVPFGTAVPSGDRPPRLAVFGVPSIFRCFAESLEALGAHVVLWETESDFAMIPPAESLEDQYLEFAYPYGIQARVAKFLRRAQDRAVDGVLIYSQAFCQHNLELVWARRSLAEFKPNLLVEGDLPAPLAPRDSTRIEAFLEMLRAR